MMMISPPPLWLAATTASRSDQSMAISSSQSPEGKGSSVPSTVNVAPRLNSGATCLIDSSITQIEQALNMRCMVYLLTIYIDVDYAEFTSQTSGKANVDSEIKMGMRSSLSNRLVIYYSRKSENLPKAQKRALIRILRNAKGTMFSRDFGLDGVHSVREYQKCVSVNHYEDLRSYWDMVENGMEKVFTNEPVFHFAMSSGTTGHKKLVPLAKCFVGAVRMQQLHAFSTYLRRNPHSSILGKTGLAITGRSRIMATESGIPCGMVSGIMLETAHPVIKRKALPTIDTMNLEDWEEKLEQIVTEATNRKVGFMVGLPSAVLAFLVKAREVMSGEEFRFLAEGLELICLSGVNYRTYEELILSALGKKDVDFIDIYMCSEGMMGCESADDPDAIELFTDQFFFEFIPYDEYLKGDYKHRKLITELDPGEEVVLLVTNGSGAFSYVLGDVLKCVRSDGMPQFRISGRTQLTLNIVTEKTTQSAVEKTVMDVSKDLGATPKEFFVTAKIVDNLPRYIWVFEQTPQWLAIDKASIGKKLDEYLVKHNDHFKNFINTQLAPSEVVFLEAAEFEEWLSKRGSEQGHQKVPRIINDYKMVECVLEDS